ncbi:signal peptidase I [candidate division WWE3 bacterium]|nr:signal peptidase I [candidate division WWE3 bacterium]
MKTLNNLKKLIGTSYWIFVGIILFFGLLTTLSLRELPGGIRAFVVQSGSMEPAIKTGSVVVIKPKETYKIDEVITFKLRPDSSTKTPKDLVTHRIIEKAEDEGRNTYLTKGDANEDADREMIREDQILGRVFVSVPLVGKILAFSQTQVGFILLIILPAILIIYTELQKIFNNLFKKNSKEGDTKKETQANTEDNNIKKETKTKGGGNK